MFQTYHLSGKTFGTTSGSKERSGRTCPQCSPPHWRNGVLMVGVLLNVLVRYVMFLPKTKKSDTKRYLECFSKREISLSCAGYVKNWLMDGCLLWFSVRSKRKIKSCYSPVLPIPKHNVLYIKRQMYLILLN